MTPGGSAGRLVMTFSSSSGGRGSSPVGPGGQDCDEAGCGHAPMRSGPGPAGDFITAAGRADRSRQRHRAAGRGKGQTRPAAAHPYSQSWQIVPTVLPELIQDPDPEKSERVMRAMFTMKKLEIDALRAAAAPA